MKVMQKRNCFCTFVGLYDVLIEVGSKLHNPESEKGNAWKTNIRKPIGIILDKSITRYRRSSLNLYTNKQ